MCTNFGQEAWLAIQTKLNFFDWDELRPCQIFLAPTPNHLGVYQILEQIRLLVRIFRVLVQLKQSHVDPVAATDQVFRNSVDEHAFACADIAEQICVSVTVAIFRVFLRPNLILLIISHHLSHFGRVVDLFAAQQTKNSRGEHSLALNKFLDVQLSLQLFLGLEQFAMKLFSPCLMTAQEVGQKVDSWYARQGLKGIFQLEKLASICRAGLSF